jgi:hypothetical protein
LVQEAGVPLVLPWTTSGTSPYLLNLNFTLIFIIFIISFRNMSEEEDKRRPRRKSVKRWPNYWQPKYAKLARTEIVQRYPKGSENSLSIWGPTYKDANSLQKNIRRVMRYKGDGDYTSMAKYGLRGLGAAAYAGRQLYRGRGLKAASRAAVRGYDKGAQVSKLFGFGDYSTSNQIVSGTPADPNQSIHHISTAENGLSGDIMYSNTEFVKNIYATVVSGTSNFQVESFPLNPGLADTFPFLSQIAQNFELFEFVGLAFQYKPTSGEFGSNNSNALGKVVLATNYDPDASLFINSVVMENYDYACSTKPSSGCVHGVECKPTQRATMQMYTRTGTSTKDKVFTDLGIFQIASEGIPSSVAQDVLIGELWVTYTVKLSRAKLYQALGESIGYVVYHCDMGTDSFNNIVSESTSTLQNTDCTVVVGTPTKISIGFGADVVGSYLIILRSVFNAGTALQWGQSNSGFTSIEQALSTNFAGTSTQKCYAVKVNIDPDAADSRLTFSPSVAVTAGDLTISVTKVDKDMAIDYIP